MDVRSEPAEHAAKLPGQGEQADGGSSRLSGANYFWFFTACMLVTAVGYVLWSQYYRGSTYIQGDDEPVAPVAT